MSEMRVRVDKIQEIPGLVGGRPGWCASGDYDQNNHFHLTWYGPDAQRLAYEYAAGVLGKGVCDCPVRTRAYPGGVMGVVDCACKPDSFFAAYAQARDAAEKMWSGKTYAPASPWISVKERMPAPRNFVLVSSGKEGMYGHIVVAERNDGAWFWVNPEGTLPRYNRTVTHWMPLPEPPKE